MVYEFDTQINEKGTQLLPSILSNKKKQTEQNRDLKSPLVELMGKLRKPPVSSPDLNTTLCEIFGDCISKHRSCWLHIVAYRYRSQKKITWEEVEQIKRKYRHTSPCFSRKFPHFGRSSLKRSNNMSDIGCSNQISDLAIKTHKGENKLDTCTFEYYLESLWKTFSEDKKMPFTYLDSLWFSSYRNPSTRPKVLSWIKQKHIFSKKYVFVPIVCWGHWSLLILVHFGESSDSETRTPCMLLLDSLENADPKRLEPEIRKFVVDIYKAEGRAEDKKAISQIPLLVPKVPQQKDDEECGNYVLYFINKFMEAAPENFSVSNGYPYFMIPSWFNPENMESFRSNLERDQSITKKNTNNVCKSRHKLRKQDGIIAVDD